MRSEEVQEVRIGASVRVREAPGLPFELRGLTGTVSGKWGNPWGAPEDMVLEVRLDDGRGCSGTTSWRGSPKELIRPEAPPLRWRERPFVKRRVCDEIRRSPRWHRRSSCARPRPVPKGAATPWKRPKKPSRIRKPVGSLGIWQTASMATRRPGPGRRARFGSAPRNDSCTASVRRLSPASQPNATRLTARQIHRERGWKARRSERTPTRML
jgi:hypothetical protein